MSLALAGCSDSTTEPTPPSGVAAISINPSELTFASLGITVPLDAIPLDADGNQLSGVNITWSTAGSGVVNVSSTGVVTAIGNGVEKVRAKVADITSEVSVTVQQVGVAVQLTASSNTLTWLGSTLPLNAKVLDANGRQLTGVDFTFTSGNPLVLPVQVNGVVTAARPGTSVIQATSGGLTGSLSLSVNLTGPFGGPIVGSPLPCSGGMAGPFPCSGISLISYLPLGGLGANANLGTDLNDLWGWTDSQTGKEYAIVMRRDGTAFIELSDPANPQYLGFLPITPGAVANTWHDVKVYQDHAYIVSDGAGQHGMQVFDLRQLRTPSAAPRQFTANVTYNQIASAHNIFINESSGFAYVVGSSAGGTTCGGGLHMINISNPATPLFSGCFADAATGRAGTGYTHDVQCVDYRGPDAAHFGREICFGSNETHLSIADVTSKSAPLPLSRTSYPGVAYTHQGWLTEDQRYFLVNDELDEQQGTATTTRTLIWDVSDLDDPILAKQYFGPTAATDHNHYIRGNLMYASNYQFGLRVVDVSNPVNPLQVGFFDTAPNQPNIPGFGGSWSNYPFFASGIIVVTSRTEGLFVLRMQ
jgi:choice-of-anchor B domain-containing protein